MVPIPLWLHSTFKELSNEYSHAQIRVKTKKLWPRQVGEKKQAAVRKVCRDRKEVCRDRCRDKQQYVATSVATNVTTSSMSRPMSRHGKLSRPVSRQESFVATRNLCRDQKRCRNLKKTKFDILIKFQAHFTLGPYIYSFFR